MSYSCSVLSNQLSYSLSPATSKSLPFMNFRFDIESPTKYLSEFCNDCITIISFGERKKKERGGAYVMTSAFR